MDKVLLEAIKEFFNVGNIYYKHSNIGQYAVRSRKDLLNKIIPYYQKYSLIGLKLNSFKIELKIMEILETNRHLKSTLDGRDAIIEICELIKLLNLRNNINQRKLERLNYIINWLKKLKAIPTKEEIIKF